MRQATAFRLWYFAPPSFCSSGFCIRFLTATLDRAMKVMDSVRSCPLQILQRLVESVNNGVEGLTCHSDFSKRYVKRFFSVTMT